MNEHYAVSLQRRLFEAFKAQDNEKGHFDVVFDINGKVWAQLCDFIQTSLQLQKLGANKCILASASQTFNVQFSHRWNMKDEDVQIPEHTYKVFYTFLCFLYSGMCNLDIDNVCAMVDLAEYYGVPDLTAKCDGFLAHIECETDEVFYLHERLNIYPLERFKSKFRSFIYKWYEKLLEAEELLAVGPATLENIVSYKRLFFCEELLFQKVWGIY